MERWPLKPTPQMIGQAGAHYAAAELLKCGILATIVGVDVGYDLMTDCLGKISRVQVKTELEGFRDRPELHQLRYSLRRRKAKKLTESDTTNLDKRYTTDMIDAMAFVTFRHQKLFIVPASQIDFTRDWIYYRELEAWENAWWVLADKNLIDPSFNP